ncbi:MAG: hypothetical protein AAB035_06315 [Nitrospirota bacterium]
MASKNNVAIIGRRLLTGIIRIENAPTDGIESPSARLARTKMQKIKTLGLKELLRSKADSYSFV